MKFINIQPKELILEAQQIGISILHIDLNVMAVVRVQLYSQDSKLIDSNEFILEGEDYQNWINDDYLIQYVCNKYGYTRIPAE